MVSSKIDDAREREIIVVKVDNTVKALRSAVTNCKSVTSNLKSEVDTILPSYTAAMTAAEKAELNTFITAVDRLVDDFGKAVSKLNIKR